MKVVIVIPPKDFKDETVSNISLMLKKWNIEYVIASAGIGSCFGYHGAVLDSKMKYTEIQSRDFDCIILPDGMGVELYKLYDSRQLLDIIKHFNENGKLVACIGNAIKILARANIISNKKIATVKDPEIARLAKLFRGVVTDNPIEADGQIITASDSESSMEFSKKIVDSLGVT